MVGHYGYISSSKNDQIQEILTVERDKRNELSTKYNWGVDITGVNDNCLGVLRLV